jgi:hypothetical protein
VCGSWPAKGIDPQKIMVPYWTPIKQNSLIWTSAQSHCGRWLCLKEDLPAHSPPKEKKLCICQIKALLRHCPSEGLISA